MAKIKWVTTPKAAYEWVEVGGGDTMTEAQRSAFLDEYVEDNGLVPVESTFVGEVPVHKYGRYKATSAVASALPPVLPGREDDLVKANADKAALEQEVARLKAQLGKQEQAGKGAEVVDADDAAMRGTATGGAQTTEDARAAFNEQSDDKLVGSGEEVRRDSTSNDKSDNNPKVDTKSTKAKS
jgi:hypothetical protein